MYIGFTQIFGGFLIIMVAIKTILSLYLLNPKTGFRELLCPLCTKRHIVG